MVNRYSAHQWVPHYWSTQTEAEHPLLGEVQKGSRIGNEKVTQNDGWGVPPRAEIQYPWTWNMTTSNASEKDHLKLNLKKFNGKKMMRSQFKWGEGDKEQGWLRRDLNKGIGICLVENQLRGIQNFLQEKICRIAISFSFQLIMKREWSLQTY